MGHRLIVSDNRDDPGNPLVLDGEAIDAAAQDPLAIGKLMVDQVWAEGTDPTGGGLYYERNSNQHRRLQAFETGSEDFMTGGWVRVLATAEQVHKERPGMERAAKASLVSGAMAPTGACCWWSSWTCRGAEQPPQGSGRQRPSSAPGPVLGWRAWRPSRGCGGWAFARVLGAGMRPQVSSRGCAASWAFNVKSGGSVYQLHDPSAHGFALRRSIAPQPLCPLLSAVVVVQ
jgi:hypothetical protein